jgi:hypothetical protein
MKALIDAGLFGQGLVNIDSKLLVDRYNACLEEIGLKKTKLKSFAIDQVGWSPEVADEMKNDHYLSHGEANPFAIIVTPNQEQAPIYFPFHSYDWEAMSTWFRTYRTQIADITRDAGLWVDIDQDVNLYDSPSDLLMVHEVMLKTHATNGIIGEAIRQKDLLTKFIQEQDAHLDVELIEKLRKSAKVSGDLRSRSCVIRDFQFVDVQDFYSRVMDGVFIFRSHGGEPFIVAQNTTWAKSHKVCHADLEVVNELMRLGYLECDFVWWKKHIAYLHTIAESFLMDVLEEKEPELEFFKLNGAQQKGIIRKHARKLESYLTLTRVIDAVRCDEAPQGVPEELLPYLLHPAQTLSNSSREVVEHLLSIVREGRMVQMFYRYQKSEFAQAYSKEWNAPKREWSLLRIREHYERIVRLRSMHAA